MAQWIGYMVSVDCNEKGIYQGEIVNATSAAITLTKTFCDGIPCKTSEVTLLVGDIADLKLIEKSTAETNVSTVTIAKPVAKRANRTHTVSESAAQKKVIPNNQNTDHQPQQKNDSIKQENNTPLKLGTPVKKDNNNKKDKVKYNRGWRDEATFGSPLDTADIETDFDFEKNLALFDKQAIFGKINSQKPDVVRHTVQKRNSKYRHDENVIAAGPTTYRQISVPKQEIREYVTDDGLVIPSVSKGLRQKLWTAAERLGVTWERRMELMGRAATEISLQLLGGGHRLNPRNTHQWPTVVVLCGPHQQGAMGINTARQLSTQGVNTVLYTVPSDLEIHKQELALYKLTKNKIVSADSGLPHIADLIIIALSDENDNGKQYGNLADWTNSNRAPVLALDPPANGTHGIATKFSLVPVLPLAHSSENGKIYLCNLSFPLQVFQEIGIKYQSPFGPKFVIPLHPNGDS